jgi:hypothetical protein
MERMAGSAGSAGEVPRSTGGMTGATSTGTPDTGSTGYQQPGTRTQATAEYGERAPSLRGAALSILAGALAFLEGLAYVIRSHYYHTLPGYAYRWTLHGWGWVLLILGAILFAAGVSNLLGIKGSRQFAAAMAVITAVVAFLTIFYSFVWGIVVVAACAFAAANLLSDRGTEERYPAEMDYGAGGQGREREEAMSRGPGSHRRS